MKRIGLPVIAALALASCGGDPAEVDEPNEDATARGEVLGGTISDDMLPLDTVTSQSPPRAGQAQLDSGNADTTSEPAAEPAQEVTDDEEAPAPQAVAEPEPAAEE